MSFEKHLQFKNGKVKCMTIHENFKVRLMKKITILASTLLLAGAYQASAQMGIGTPNPSNATMLEVQATDKGVLIPRVELTSTTVFAPIAGTQENSILVYNTNGTFDPEVATTVYPGFYYWQEGEWQRIVNQADLNAAIENLENTYNTSFEQIHDLINYIVPSNPNNVDGNGNQIVPQPHSTVVWDGNSFYIVTYDPATEEYTKNIIDLDALIEGLETNTFIREVIEFDTDDITVLTPKIYYYYSEKAIKDWVALNPTSDIATMPETAPGVVKIDVVGDVVNNFEYILEQEITYEGDTHTIEEIIQMISSEVEGNVIYTEITPGEWVFQYFDGTDYVTINLDELVATLETNTFIRKIEADVDADGTVTTPTVYYYFSEEAIKAWKALDPDNNIDPEAPAPDGMPETAPGVIAIKVADDVAENFEYILNQTITYEGEQVTIENIIKNISSQVEGNVIYVNDKDENDPNAPDNWVFQYFDGTEYVTINLGDLVADLETKTNITRAEIETDATAPVYGTITDAPVDADTKAGEIIYKYEAEGETNYLNITEDMLFAIEHNVEVRNEINEILKAGGNVYFGDVEIGGDSYTNVLYYFDADGNPQLVELAPTLIQNLIDNSTHLQNLKNVLGNKYKENTIIYTGDTINNNPVAAFTTITTIGAHTAETSGVTLPVTPVGVVAISLYKEGVLVTNSTTDHKITGDNVNFNIGIGNHYQVLPQGDYEVIIEFTVAP